jgi:hypothetical protein
MRQGARNDIQAVKSKLDNGASMEDIADQHFSIFLQYRKGLGAYLSMKQTQRNYKTVVIVLWGATGVGKTRFVYDQAQDRQVWVPGDYQWFDGYRGQDIVLLDDYRGEYPIQFFLKLCDRYPMQVPVKGDFVNWRPTKIYITSNLRPKHWYDNLDTETRPAFMRRLDQIHEIRDPLYPDI